MLCLEFDYVFRLSVSMRKIASERPFCVLIYMNSYIFHIYFNLFIFLSNTYLTFDFICVTMMMIAFITIKSSLVPLIEGLCAHIYFRFEISVVC